MALEKRAWEGQERPWFLGEKGEKRGRVGKRKFLGARKSEKAVKSGPMVLEKRAWEGQERPWFLGEKGEER
ncbi:hypothetical protein BOO22_15070 [Vibrio cidicii]|nr:hypothetical protein [Vibrio cidicii]